MITGLYSAASAMDNAATRHEASAENLANAHLPGYRRRVVQQNSFATELSKTRDTSGMSPLLGIAPPKDADGGIRLDFTHGAMKQTGRSLDVALEGDGFFVVEGPNGPLYTRNGAFMASPDGRLVTTDMLSVIGRNGPINIPANLSSEAITVTGDGRLLGNGIEFGQLATVQFADKTKLTAVGASLLQAADDVVPQDSNDPVLQGFLEQGNVSHMEELVNILVASRQYEAAQKVLTVIDQSMDKRIGVN